MRVRLTFKTLSKAGSSENKAVPTAGLPGLKSHLYAAAFEDLVVASTSKKEPPMYDIIGDIHGFAEPLKQLLTKLGYSEIDGVCQHPTRKALFLGDYIDRGPQQVEVVRIVRAMEQAGHALAILGNHEFNAVA